MLDFRPSLGGLPALEVLILSHNQLRGSLENLKSSMRIKRLDLAYNEFAARCSSNSAVLNRGLDAIAVGTSTGGHEPFEKPSDLEVGRNSMAAGVQRQALSEQVRGHLFGV